MFAKHSHYFEVYSVAGFQKYEYDLDVIINIYFKRHK